MRLPPLESGILLRRYKRFLADVRLADGSSVTVHCPNSGSMLGCDRPGSPVLLSVSDNPRRKYARTLEMVQVEGVWVGINTSRTNRIVEEGLRRGIVRELAGFEELRREVRVSDRSRLDFCLRFSPENPCPVCGHDVPPNHGDTGVAAPCDRRGLTWYVEVKNCTLAADGVARFPDACTTRGSRHLEELVRLVRAGHGAAVLFCVQRADADRFAPAAAIDPQYAADLQRAAAAGVLVLAYQASVSPREIELVRPLPVVL